MSQNHSGDQHWAPPASASLNRQPAVPPVVRRPIAAVALLGALLVAVLAVLVAGDTSPNALDRSVQSAIGGTASSGRSVALAVDWLGEPVGRPLAVLLLAAGCLALGRRRLAVLAVAGPALASVATFALKPVVGRYIHEEFLAYPSGHTSAMVALGFVLGLLLVDLFATGHLAAVLIVVGAATVAGAAMAWSQVVLDAHYPTDTLGGFGTALAVVPATAWLIDRAAATRLNPSNLG